MVVNRQITYEKIDQYFKELSEKNTDILDYCGTSELELAEKLNSVDGIKSPILVFFNYEGKLDGNLQRTLANRTLGFAILIAGISPDDIPGQKTAKTRAEAIGLEVLSRINFDSKNPSVDWLYNNLDKSSITFTEVNGEQALNLYGFDFYFDLRVLEPLVINKEKWTDGEGLPC